MRRPSLPVLAGLVALFGGSPNSYAQTPKEEPTQQQFNEARRPLDSEIIGLTLDLLCAREDCDSLAEKENTTKYALFKDAYGTSDRLKEDYARRGKEIPQSEARMSFVEDVIAFKHLAELRKEKIDLSEEDVKSLADRINKLFYFQAETGNKELKRYVESEARSYVIRLSETLFDLNPDHNYLGLWRNEDIALLRRELGKYFEPWFNDSTPHSFSLANTIEGLAALHGYFGNTEAWRQNPYFQDNEKAKLRVEGKIRKLNESREN